MIYLDYSATTPVDEEILDIYCQTTREYIGNPNSSHDLGQKSKNRLYSAMSTISNIFHHLIFFLSFVIFVFYP